MQIVDRCLQTYLPKSVSMLLLKAQLLEEVDRIDETRKYLDSILETTCPQLLEASIFYEKELRSWWSVWLQRVSQEEESDV